MREECESALQLVYSIWRQTSMMREVFDMVPEVALDRPMQLLVARHALGADARCVHRLRSPMGVAWDSVIEGVVDLGTW